MDRIYLKDLKNEFRTFADWKYDPWGSAMSAAFQVCNELYYRNPNIGVLATVQYSPGALAAGDPRDPEDEYFEILQDVHSGDLVAWLLFLDRYTRLLTAKGENY